MRAGKLVCRLIGMFAGLLITGSAIAADSNEVKADKIELQKDKQEFQQTRMIYKKLHHGVDLWHDANLKGDTDKIRKYRNRLFELIRSDLTNSRQEIARGEAELSRSWKEFKGEQPKSDEKADDRHDLRDDVNDLKQRQLLARTKAKLFVTLKRSEAFSNRFRLLNDYLDLLRGELNINRIEVAEDIKELREDINQ